MLTALLSFIVKAVDYRMLFQYLCVFFVFGGDGSSSSILRQCVYNILPESRWLMHLKGVGWQTGTQLSWGAGGPVGQLEGPHGLRSPRSPGGGAVAFPTDGSSDLRLVSSQYSLTHPTKKDGNQWMASLSWAQCTPLSPGRQIWACPRLVVSLSLC